MRADWENAQLQSHEAEPRLSFILMKHTTSSLSASFHVLHESELSASTRLSAPVRPSKDRRRQAPPMSNDHIGSNCIGKMAPRAPFFISNLIQYDHWGRLSTRLSAFVRLSLACLRLRAARRP